MINGFTDFEFENSLIRHSQMVKKKWQATHIAPLQPPILAVFLPWGGSAGAGRVRPAGAKVINNW